MTLVRNVVKRNFNRDSIQLLHLSEEAKKIDGIKDAAVVMGTTTNKEILTQLGLLTGDGKNATESDMILAVMAESESDLRNGLGQFEEIILRPPETKGGNYYSVEAALQALPDANLAIVSIPGEYAREQVLKLLDKGLSVHLFSDHVPLEHELELKQYAKSKGLLVMGPGAGTALIGGKAIAFANAIRRGKVGIVAAAGTGLQEISVLLSQAGLGVSEGLGTGGGDVKSTIGGIMMLQSIDALERNPETDTIVVVSKPPNADVRRLMLEHIMNHTKKQYVTCFLGPESYDVPLDLRSRVKGTKTLHAAFSEAVRKVDPVHQPDIMKRFAPPVAELRELAEDVTKGLREEQRYIRGLYTGGTLAYETLILLGEMIGEVYSNAPLDPRLKLADSNQSLKDSIIDLGEEEFTAGRAHPMIDPTIRKMRLVQEAKDSETAVILMDMMLGYGSHSDPSGAMLTAIAEAKQTAKLGGRTIPILAHVCGTEQDPQPLSEQEGKLRNAGVHLFKTNAIMAITAAMIAKRAGLNDNALRDIYGEFLVGF